MKLNPDLRNELSANRTCDSTTLPSTKPTRTITKLSPDFRGAASPNKHTNSEMNPKPTRREMTATVRPTVYPGAEPGFPPRETGRAMTQPRALNSQVTKSIRRAYRARTTGLYLVGRFYVPFFSHLLPSATPTSQAVWTQQPCGSSLENLLFNAVVHVSSPSCLCILIACICIFIVPTGTLRPP